MEIKMKLANVINLNNTVKAIIDNEQMKVDALFKFKLLGIMKKLESYIGNFVMIRNEKIEEYGTANKDGSISVKEDDIDAFKKFNDDMSKVLNSDVTVHIEKFNANEVFHAGVSADYLVGLYDIISEK